MSKGKHNLIVVAHPDDETLFFAGLALSQPKSNWHIACVTDGNADGEGAKRLAQFRKACKRLGAKVTHEFKMPDRFDTRLDIDSIRHHLSQLPMPHHIYTHGPLGEYGHPHHQDVAWAVHSHFSKNNVWSPAYNCAYEKKIVLTKSQYKIKCQILSQIYFSETKRFAHFIPCQATEGYTQFSIKEVDALYRHLAHGTPLNLRLIDVYKWFSPYLTEFKKQTQSRPF